MTRKLVKSFVFDEDIRSRLTFSNPAKIRLNPVTGGLELKEQSIEKSTGLYIYSTEANLYVQIASINPTSLVKWIGFAASPNYTLQPTGTSVAYRLNNGATTYYWDGGAWSVPGANDWSSEQDVAAHIDTFPASSKTLSIIINLRTTDKYYTPHLDYLDVLMECNISFLRSLIGDSLIPALRDTIAPVITFGIRAPGGTIVSLKDIETPYNILSVVGVYNNDADPGHQTNLYSAYNTISKNITLTGSVAAGTALYIEFAIEVDTYLRWASQDYLEVEKLPALVITVARAVGHQVSARQSIVDVSTNTAVVIRSPIRLHIEIDVLLLAEGNRSLLEMWDRVLEYHNKYAVLNWTALDQNVSMRMVNEGSLTPQPSLKDDHTASYSLVLENVYLWLRDAEDLYTIQTFNLTQTAPDMQGGSRYTGAR